MGIVEELLSTTVDRRFLTRSAVVVFVYLILARIGFLTALPPGNVSAVWPPAGVALAVMLMYGYSMIPAVAVGALLANLWALFDTTDSLTIALSVLIAVSIALGAVIQASIGAYFVRRFTNKVSPFYKLVDVFRFIAIAALTVVIRPAFGMTGILLCEAGHLVYHPFTWWMGDFVGVVVVTPLILVWTQKYRSWTWLHSLEGLALLLLVIVASYAIFTPSALVGNVYFPWKFWLIPFLLWAAIRFGQQGTMTVVALISCIALVSSIINVGPFGHERLNQALLILQSYFAILTTFGLALAAALMEREQAELDLKRLNQGLEVQVADRTSELHAANVSLQNELDKSNRLFREVRQRAAELGATLSSIADGIIIYGPDSSIVNMNEQAQQLLGYTEADMRKTVSERLQTLLNVRTVDGGLYPEDEMPAVRALKGEIVQGAVMIIKTPFGDPVWVSSSAAPIKLENGEIIGGVTTFTDITPQVKVENELRQLNEDLESRVKERTAELENAYAEIENVSYTVAHDLRTPLRGINSFTNLLAAEYANRIDEAGHAYISRILSASARMGQLLECVLALIRVIRVEPEKETFDLGLVVEDILSRYAAMNPERNIRYSVEKNVMVCADRHLLTEALDRIIDNSWKFTLSREMALISFSVREENGEIVYNISDNGIGFDMKYVNKLFKPFHSLHNGTGFAGAGMGLAIVQRIINRHGGRVWAEGSVSKGATLSFTLGG